MTRIVRMIGAGMALGLALAGCSSGSHKTSAPPEHPPSTTTTTTPPLSTTTTSTVPLSVPTCTQSQLAAQYDGFQGSTGFWFTGFVIANTASAPCALRSRVSVELLDGQGGTRTTSNAIYVPILLSAKGIIPPLGQNPAQGQLLAYLGLYWPTLPDAIDQLGGSGDVCPQPIFQPEAAEVTFADTAPLMVDGLSNPAPPGADPAICGSFLRVSEMDSRTAPQSP